MTPYVVDDVQSSSPQQPKSIMVHNIMTGDMTHRENDSKPNGKVSGIPADILVEKSSNDDVSPVTPSERIFNGRIVGAPVVLANGRPGKGGVLKRVSFGSSKGSMVETLIYDHHDDLLELPIYTVPLTVNGEETPLKPPAKVRVTFYESQKPNFVTTPQSPEVPSDFILSPNMASSPRTEEPPYNQQISTENELENPFRPDGDLSREAETIVSLIKEGKPITPAKIETDDSGLGDIVHSPLDSMEPLISPVQANEVNSSKSDINGKAPSDKTPLEPGVVEVQHGIVAPSDSQQVEPVVIKKTPKCKCCVIQ
ncbi:uncharacterized protein LOC143235266 [Tachypleus tridentatus]|uniref:uncharacterized protein LOC143235266 n=1 Tax=Tachypleus tridentatus TaxID=6853 RepID=UPI003FD02EBF